MAPESRDRELEGETWENDCVVRDIANLRRHNLGIDGAQRANEAWTEVQAHENLKFIKQMHDNKLVHLKVLCEDLVGVH